MLYNRLKKGGFSRVVTETAAAFNLRSDVHSGQKTVLGRAAGQDIRLPKASGSGHVYHLIVKTSISSNTTTIKVIDAVDAFQGRAEMIPSANGAVSAFLAVAGTSDTFTLNGTTTGGIRGTEIVLTDIATGLWQITQADLVASGTVATPFSATVS